MQLDLLYFGTYSVYLTVTLRNTVFCNCTLLIHIFWHTGTSIPLMIVILILGAVSQFSDTEGLKYYQTVMDMLKDAEKMCESLTNDAKVTLNITYLLTRLKQFEVSIQKTLLCETKSTIYEGLLTYYYLIIFLLVEEIQVRPAEVGEHTGERNLPKQRVSSERQAPPYMCYTFRTGGGNRR